MARNGREAMDVLVTGAAGGVGSQLTRRLDGLGHRVFAGVRRPEDARGLGARVVPVVLDVTDDAAIAAAVAQVREVVGAPGLDALVNGAGMIVQGPLELVSSSALGRQLDVNVVGPLAVTRAFLPGLRQRRGRVVNVGASTGRVAVPFYGAISASKAALASLTDVLRMELRHLGVEVVLVEPGAMQTPIWATADAFAQATAHDAPAATRALYDGAIAAATSALTRAPRAKPDATVTAIVKALTARSPDARVLVGRDARGLSALRWLPQRSRDRLLERTTGFTRAAFSGTDPAAAAGEAIRA